MSTTILTLKGQVNQVLAINKKSLSDFFVLIEKIKLPKELEKEAKRLNIPVMYHVKTIEQLLMTLLNPNWRLFPMRYDVPANSQILGQICYSAGIEAILYQSKITKKKCLAIFPENFLYSNSFVEIDGGIPAEITHKRLDSKTSHILI